MTTISDKTRFPLAIVAVLVSAGITLGGAAAVAQLQINDHDLRVKKLEERERDTDRRVQRTEDFVPEVREELKELRGDVKELLRRRQP
jgi:hypothetical protein